MKKLYFFLTLACIPFLANAAGSCAVQIQAQNCLCFGDCNGSAMAFPIGTGPFLYTWLPGGETTQGITNLCPGNYTVIVTDANNCTSTASCTITEPTQITIATSVTNESCNGCCDGNIVSTVQGGTPGYTYMWAPSGQTSPVLQSACSGTYTLCVTDMNGCTSCDVSTVSFSTGIRNETTGGNLSVFPVPATETVNIRQTFAKPVSATIRVTNVLGETVFASAEREGVQLDIQLDVSELTAGVYFITVTTGEGASIARFVKQ